MVSPAATHDRELFFWLALCMAPGIGAIRFAQLIKRFQTPEAVFKASASELALLPRLPKETIAALNRFDWEHKVEGQLDRARRLGCRLIKLNDRDYPARLGQIRNPPPVLWVAGDIRPEDEAAVAIVGSRGATEYGLATAHRLARELVSAGINVVSGVALGIDAAAHYGALSQGGRTFGVLGCGLDVVYPRTNRELFRKIPASGALISEFPLGTAPEPGHFPARNRVIAGLSLAVVVVEAGRRSGALITARMALDENREVMAVPGRAGARTSQGTNNLLKQGALLVETGQEILDEIAPQLVIRYTNGQTGGAQESPRDLLEEEKMIWEALGSEPMHFNMLVRKLGVSPEKLAPILLDLELKSLIRQLPGMRYIKE